MAAQPLQLRATDQHKLNQALRALQLSNPLDLLMQTPSWFPTSWQLITAGSSDTPEVQLNGRPVPLRLIETWADRNLWTIEPFWSEATLPEAQWICITGPCELLQLQAQAGISPWQLLQLLRLDVARATLDPWRSWLLNNGIHEYNLLRQHPAVLAALNQPIEGTTMPWFHWALRQQRADLQAAISPQNTAGLRHWLIHHGATEHQLEPINPQGLLISRPVQLQPWSQRRFGVNLFGYADDVLGIGEDLRTVDSALRSAKIPVQVVDIPREPSSHQLRELALLHADQLAPYAFNLFCLSAEEHARVLLELGEHILRERYSIGYWPWELSRWPQPWQPLLAMVDEVWSSSQYTYSTLQAAIAERPSPSLQHLPLPVEPLQPLSHEQRRCWRDQFQLPRDAPLLICSFDGRSSYNRKNPWAAIHAFQQAVSQGSEAQLLIKTMHAGLEPEQWKQLQACAAADSRLLLIDAVLERDQLLGLYGCCDVLISLHRAEGYGRVLAEALLLGLDVVATNYSGNTDFCIGPLAHPVPYTLQPVLPDQYPYAQHQVWAEPDLQLASVVLQQVLRRRAREPNRRFDHVAFYSELFNPAILGQRYAQRLEHLWRTKSTQGEPLERTS